MKFDLNNVLGLFGGVSGLIANAAKTLTKGKIDLTAEGIDSGADRILTISEKDHREACKKLGIKEPDVVAKGLKLARLAGDHGGNYLAFMAKEAADIPYEDEP